MKVKCIKYYNEGLQKFEEASSAVTIGKIYVVLEVVVCSPTETRDRIFYRIFTDSDTYLSSPALLDSRQFEVVSGKIPSNWGVKQYHSGSLTFGPRDWLETEFWEGYFNLDRKMEEIYKRELRTIFAEEDALDQLKELTW